MIELIDENLFKFGSEQALKEFAKIRNKKIEQVVDKKVLKFLLSDFV